MSDPHHDIAPPPPAPVEIREADTPPVPSAAVITQRLREHLAKLPRGSCMFCGSDKDWQPLAWGHTVIYIGPETDALPVAVKPGIVLECGACGLTVTMNARTAGVLPA